MINNKNRFRNRIFKFNEYSKRNDSVVILFCDIEFSRPVRGGMLVENSVFY
jgi:hypothetical protein